MIRIAWYEETPGCAVYVSDLPGHGGKDWGYDARPQKAVPLSEYWQRRFVRDMERVGREARLGVGEALGEGRGANATVRG